MQHVLHLHLVLEVMWEKTRLFRKALTNSLCNLYSEIKLEEAAVLHYTYAKFSDLTSRRDRCGCKPTKEDVKRCFMLEFDRSVSSFLVP